MRAAPTIFERRGSYPLRVVLALVVMAAAGALATAFGLEHLGGYAPCSLCILERWPWAAALVAGVIGLAIGGPRTALAVAALALVGNALVSAYHVGVEAGWFALPSSCAAGGGASTIEELRAQLQMARPTCDRVALRVFGLSLAAWNGLAAAAVAALAAATLLRAPRSGEPPALNS